MAKQLYAPLVFIEKCNKYGGYSEKNLKDNYYDHFLKDVIHIPKDKLPSIDWIIKYALSNKFMKSCKHHAEECMDDICHTELIIQHGLGDFIDVECMKLAVQILTSSKEVSTNNANVIRAEMRDLFVQLNFFWQMGTKQTGAKARHCVSKIFAGYEGTSRKTWIFRPSSIQYILYRFRRGKQRSP